MVIIFPCIFSKLGWKLHYITKVEDYCTVPFKCYFENDAKHWTVSTLVGDWRRLTQRLKIAYLDPPYFFLSFVFCWHTNKKARRSINSYVTMLPWNNVINVKGIFFHKPTFLESRLFIQFYNKILGSYLL